MSDTPDTPKRGWWATTVGWLKDHWFLVAFAGSIVVAGWNGWNALAAKADTNTTTLQSLVTQMEEFAADLAARAEASALNREVQDLWDAIREASENGKLTDNEINEMQRTFNDLILSDQRLQAAIELQGERIRREVEQATREQTLLLNEILREITR